MRVYFGSKVWAWLGLGLLLDEDGLFRRRRILERDGRRGGREEPLLAKDALELKFRGWGQGGLFVGSSYP